MDKKWVNLTPVKHKSEHYYGWIDGTTKIDSLFTGNVVDCRWQYRIFTHEGDRKVAPIEDLEIDKESRKMPPAELRERYAELREGQSSLSGLGYSLSSGNQSQRLDLLTECAGNIVGPNAVIHNLCDIIWRKIARGETPSLDRYTNALKIWHEDLEDLLEYYDWQNGRTIDKDNFKYIISIKQRLKRLLDIDGRISDQDLQNKLDGK